MPLLDRPVAVNSTPGLGLHSRAARRDLVFLLLMALVGAGIALGVGQYALLRVARAQLNNYTDALLRQSADVAAVSIDTFGAVAAAHDPICSDANLAEMRYRAFQHKELYDIGRIGDGKLLCTAHWGRFAAPLPLQAPQRREANGDMLWRMVPHAADARIVIDMAAHGSVIVFTSPTIFESYEKFDPSFSSLTLTHDGQHIYRSLGDTEGLLERFRKGPAAFERGGRLTSSACDKTVDVCVVTALVNDNLVVRSPLTAVEVGGAGAMAALLFGWIAIRRRRHQSVPAEQLRRAIADGRLAVAYQPLVSIRDGRMIGVEALLRVSDEEGNAIPAEVIVNIAEQAGLIGAVTRIVLSEALEEMARRLTGMEEFQLSINVSPSDVTDLTFHRYLEKETERLRVPCHRIVLELTERSATNEEKLLSGVAVLRSLGYGLYIDDLGTGYSSLAYLSKLPISGVKVDKIFTQSIGRESVISTICEKICAIADTLGVDVVLEGIETADQADYFRELHPEAIGQGRFWGMPVRGEQLAGLE